MKKTVQFVFLTFILLTVGFAQRQLPVVVSTQWLSERMNDTSVVILHVGYSRAEYKLEHIPNSRFLWVNSLSPSIPDLSTEMPSMEEAAAALGTLGVTNASSIILVYSGQTVTITARMMLALSFFGFGKQTALLDGGIEQWKREGRPVTAMIPAVRKSSPRLTADSSVITDAEWIRRNLHSPNVSIVDSRTEQFYRGSGGGILRQGHIKNASNVPFVSLLDSLNRFKSVSELREIFTAANIPNGNTVVTYCHVGQQASLVYCAAKLLGYDAKVYDGSFEDWNVRDESYPVEK